MGRYYNEGWSVADTNRLASIARRLDPDYPLDKVNLHDFALWVILHRRYRTVKIMSGRNHAAKFMEDIWKFEQKRMPSKYLSINELTDDEWDFICELTVKE